MAAKAELEGELEGELDAGTGKEKGDTMDETLRNAEENLASLRRTIEAIDSLEARWKSVQKKFGEVLTASLASAYGIAPPCSLTEEEKLSVLGGEPTLEELCRRLKEGRYKKIIVMTGAGISVSSGIPDFRSPGTGLYATLDLEKYHVQSPQELFSADFFRRNPSPFFARMKQMFCTRTYQPTVAHHFIKLLATKGLLHRCYTQNIDGLERKAAIPKDLLVEAHGTFQEATCNNGSCNRKYNTNEMTKVLAAIKADQVPACDSCSEGIVKPDVVLFGEDLPQRFKELTDVDFEECDLLIVMGTSLQVQPFCSLVERVKQTTPRLLINKERAGTFCLASEGGYRDVALLEECDTAVRKVCQLCQWTRELDRLVSPAPAAAAAAVSKPAKQPHTTTSTHTHSTRTTTTTAAATTSTGAPSKQRAKVMSSAYRTRDHSHSRSSGSKKLNTNNKM